MDMTLKWNGTEMYHARWFTGSDQTTYMKQAMTGLCMGNNVHEKLFGKRNGQQMDMRGGKGFPSDPTLSRSLDPP